MRRKIVWGAGVFAAFAFGGCLDSPKSGFTFIGVSSVEAKPFYTRKRVNGRWITGHFPKRTATSANVSRKRVAEPTPAPRPAAKIATVPAPIMASAAAVAAASRARSEPPAPPGPPVPAPAPVSRAEPVPQAPAPAPPATLVVANAALVPAPEEQRLTKLRHALQARATALTTGSIPPQDQKPAPEPQSVSLDFKSGMKTTLFSDGTTVKEPFDVASMKGLAAAAPEMEIGSK